MVDLIIIAIFILGIWMGYKRGFVLQLVHLFGFIVAYLVAYWFFRDFAQVLQGWIPFPWANESGPIGFWSSFIDPQAIFYSTISFILLFVGTKIGLQIVGRVINTITTLPGLNVMNRWLGGGLGLIQVLVLTFVVVHVLMFLPWQTGHEWLNQSQIALWISERSPLL